jgi:TonB family protein
MSHGVDGYFRERRRNARRVALTTLALNGVALAVLLCFAIPMVRSYFRKPFRQIMRFGYEGPERYVPLIQLEGGPEYRAPLEDIGSVHTRPSQQGSQGLKPGASDTPNGPRPTHSTLAGIGPDDVENRARARARLASVPLVSTDELVIESMVEPVYPEELHTRGVEGRVALMALVDTTGHISEVTVVGGTGEHAFESAAVDAVWQARFRPYRIEGVAREVYALIRYRFRIY